MMNHEDIVEFPGAAPAAGSVRPLAVGLVRTDRSTPAADAYAAEIQCYAAHLGYRWVYTVRPPEDATDPVGYALGIAAALGIAVIVAYDLAQVDDERDRICADFDLAILRPPTLWRYASNEPLVQSFPIYDCTWKPSELDGDTARRLWQIHRDCLPGCHAQQAASAALSAENLD
jgi:hypothetical protein